MKHSKIRIIAFGLFLCIITCMGCGKTRLQITENPEETSIYYKVRETAIPNPDLELQGFIGTEGWVDELQINYVDEKIYRLAQTWSVTDGKMNESNRYFIQVLEEPYEKWETYDISFSYWKNAYEEIINSEEDTFYNSHVNKMYVAEDKSVYCEVLIYSSGNEDEKWMGLWNIEEQGKLFFELSSDIELHMCNGQLYDYKSGSNHLSQLDEMLQEVKKYTLPGIIYGLVYDEGSDSVSWYGIQDKCFGIWKVGDNSALIEELDQVNTLVPQDIHVTYSEDGGLFIADRENLWRLYKGREPEQVSDFSKQDYLLDFIYGMSTQGAVVRILAEFDGRRYLLSAQEEKRLLERQEIVVAAVNYSSNSGLQKAITKFNRRNGEYHITLLVPTNDEEEFKQQMQMELSIGKGPDLFLGDIIDVEGAAKNGFLQSMEDILDDDVNGKYFPAKNGNYFPALSGK